MKNFKFLWIPCLLVTLLLCAKSAQGQGFPPQPEDNPPHNPPGCDYPMVSVNISLNGNDVNIDVLDAETDNSPSKCRPAAGKLYRMTKLDLNSAIRTEIGGISFGQPAQVLKDDDLPPGEYYYMAYVWRPNDNHSFEFISEEFAVGGATSYDIVWTDQLGVSQNGTQLTRNVNTGGNCTSGAASVNTIPSGKDGWVEMTVTENWSTKFFGLSNSNADACRWSISHSVYFENQKLHIYEGGQYIGLYDNCAVEDVIRVERIGTTIEYKKNGVTFYTSDKTSHGALIADVSITDKNGTIGDSRCSHLI